MVSFQKSWKSLPENKEEPLPKGEDGNGPIRQKTKVLPTKESISHEKKIGKRHVFYFSVRPVCFPRRDLVAPGFVHHGCYVHPRTADCEVETMNPWWLLVIIPVSASFGAVLMALCVAAKRADEWEERHE